MAKTHQAGSFLQPQPRRIPWFPEWPRQHRKAVHRYQLPKDSGVSDRSSRNIVTETHPNSGICRSLYGLQQLVVCVVPRKGEGRVHNPSVNVDTEVNLEYVTLIEDYIMLRDHGPRLLGRVTSSVAPIRTVMRGTVVQTETCRKTNATFQSVLLHEGSCAVLDILGDLNHGLPWLDEFACGLPNLSVDLCRPPDVVVGSLRIFHGHTLIVAFLF